MQREGPLCSAEATPKHGRVSADTRVGPMLWVAETQQHGRGLRKRPPPLPPLFHRFSSRKDCVMGTEERILSPSLPAPVRPAEGTSDQRAHLKGVAIYQNRWAALRSLPHPTPKADGRRSTDCAFRVCRGDRRHPTPACHRSESTAHQVRESQLAPSPQTWQIRPEARAQRMQIRKARP